jgi:hypothetical protein
MMLHACDTPRLRLLRAQTMSGLLVDVKTSSRSANHGPSRRKASMYLLAALGGAA